MKMTFRVKSSVILLVACSVVAVPHNLRAQPSAVGVALDPSALGAFFAESVAFTLDYRARAAQAEAKTTRDYMSGRPVDLLEAQSSGTNVGPFLPPVATSARVQIADCKLTVVSELPTSHLRTEWDGKPSPNQMTAEEAVFDLRDVSASERYQSEQSSPSMIRIDTFDVSPDFHVTDQVHALGLPSRASLRSRVDGSWRKSENAGSSLEFLVDASRYTRDDVVSVVRSILATCPASAAPAAEESEPTEFEKLLTGLISRCWNPPALASYPADGPSVRIQLTPEGELVGTPELLNPSSDPSFEAVATAGIRAVRLCAPYRELQRYGSDYREWSATTVTFNVEEMF